MYNHLLTITWDMPIGLDLGFFTLRYYSLLFAAGFFAGYFIMKKFFTLENVPEAWLDSLVTYMVIATVLGARLGHVFFYEWGYYKNHPEKILAVWEGGLASHGAAVAIILALILYSKKVSKRSPLWILDRIVIVVALAAVFIRLGNFMNSEIYGKPANSAVEMVYLDPVRTSIINGYGQYIDDISFEKTGEITETDSLNYPMYNMHVRFASQVDAGNAAQIMRFIPVVLNNKNPDDRNAIMPVEVEVESALADGFISATFPIWAVPRYPTQLIEMSAYLAIFVLLYVLYLKTNSGQKHGFLFGMFLITLFGFRFFVEYLKANQTEFEATMALNMGQWLSIPLVIVGLYFVFTAKKSTQV
jgi:prolipoprotein diacylglyceryl transferase